MASSAIPFPFVMCPEHGKQNVYLICDHVLAGADVLDFKRCSNTFMGELVCSQCHKVQDIELLHVICEEHARYFWTQFSVN